jgi:hypothetical protein
LRKSEKGCIEQGIQLENRGSRAPGRCHKRIEPGDTRRGDRQRGHRNGPITAENSGDVFVQIRLGP